MGYKDFVRQMNRTRGAYVKVGVMAGSKHRDPGGGVSDLVTVAAANEFGTDDGHIPERSFLRSTFDEEEERLVQIAAAQHAQIGQGKQSVEQALALMGEYFQAKVVAKIHSHPAPANAPSTIKRKGSSGTLVNSGQLAQSIRYAVVGKGE